MTAFEATVAVRVILPFELTEYEAAVTEAESALAAVESGVAVADAPVEIVSEEPTLSVAEAAGNRSEALEAQGTGAAVEAERLAQEFAAGLGVDASEVLVEEVRYT